MLGPMRKRRAQLRDTDEVGREICMRGAGKRGIRRLRFGPDLWSDRVLRLLPYRCLAHHRLPAPMFRVPFGRR